MTVFLRKSLIWACSVVAACDSGRVHSPVDAGPAEAIGSKQPDVAVSLVELIVNPREFDGRNVKVMGYCWSETEHNALYLHEDDFRFGVWRNAVALSFEQDLGYARPCRGNYGVVRGEFKAIEDDSFKGRILVRQFRIQRPIVHGDSIAPP